MKRLFAAVIGISCFAGTTYAASPPAGTATAHTIQVAFSGSTASRTAFLTGTEARPVALFETRRAPDHRKIADLAYKISYIGSLILTADQVVRSVDSVLESMQLTGEDGSRIRLLLEPTSRGFEVMMKVSRPIDF